MGAKHFTMVGLTNSDESSNLRNVQCTSIMLRHWAFNSILNNVITYSLRHEAAPISLFWAPNRLNELVAVHFEFPFILSGQSLCVLKSLYTGGDPEQGIWHCFNLTRV